MGFSLHRHNFFRSVMLAWILLFCFFFGRNTQLFAQDIWQTATPPPAVGTALFASEDGTLFCGTPNGIFRRTSGASAWMQVSATPSIRALAKGANKRLFAGLNGAGFLISDDDGATWRQASTTRALAMLTIPTQGIVLAGGSSGVSRSTDNGNTFTASNTGLMNLNIRNFARHPQTGAIFAAITFAPQSGVYRSQDTGRTWTRVFDADSRRGAFAITATPSGTLLVGTQSNLLVETGALQDVLRSTDNGATWQPTSGIPEGTQIYSLTSIGTSIWAGTARGIFRSTNDGATFTQASVPFTFGVARGSFFTDGTNFLAGAEQGVYQSSDNGTTWRTFNTGLFANTGSSLFTLGTNALFSDAFRSLDNGTTWQPTGLSPTGSFVRLQQRNGGTIIGVDNATELLLRSADSGATWQAVNLGISPRLFLANLFNGSSDGEFFVVSQDLNVSTRRSSYISRTRDGGATWQTNPLRGIPDTLGIALIIRPRDTTFFALAGTNQNRTMYRSLDGGVSWTQIPLPLPDVTAVFSFASTGTLVMYNQNAKALRSSDNGATWTDVRFAGSPSSFFSIPSITAQGDSYTVMNAGNMYGMWRSLDEGASFTPISFPSMFSFPPIFTLNPSGSIFAATAAGFVRSTDKGETWSLFNSGLPAMIIPTTLTFNRSGILFGGTSTALYRTVRTTVGIRERQIATTIQCSLAPNPAVDVVSVTYTLPHPKTTRCSITNILGQVLAEFEYGTESAGTHTQTIDVRNVAQGMYFLHLQFSNEESTIVPFSVQR